MFNPRPSQASILEYKNGRMGISAVPGSGKTHTLSYLASQLILSGMLNDDQEVLIVTLVNSAVDNFSTRISGFIRESGLLENLGYRVRTLHGLAHDIVRERPDLAGISDQFSIVDESEAFRMIDQVTIAYLREHPEVTEFLVKPEIDLARDYTARNSWIEMITTLNQNFISKAKDFRSEPDEISLKMQQFSFSDVLVEMAVEVYTQYQRGLRYRNAVDFSDLIRLAHRVLENDQDFLSRLRYRWPYILEDEAQDSSGLQEQILRLLTGKDGNWVRVGDPNQAIYETFTTAKPEYLKEFLKEPGVIRRTLPNSGRSCLRIVNLANCLIDWTRQKHPVLELRDSLDLPHILPAPDGDPQPNPPDRPNSIYIKKSKASSAIEIKTVVESIKKWLPENKEKTVAVLCPIGWYGEQVVEELQKEKIEVVELLKSSQTTRETARKIEKILRALADPSKPNKLSEAFSAVLINDDLDEAERVELSQFTSNLKLCNVIEEYFYPSPGRVWELAIPDTTLPEAIKKSISDLRNYFIRWHSAVSLPIDQLIITISQDLFTTPVELALTHKFALMLEFAAQLHPEYSLEDFAQELAEISSNSRKFSGFSDEETRFDPDAYRGKVFVSTYHKAKGMEWDRVYLMSVNNYDFPSVQLNDRYMGEKWYIRDGLNPHAEVLARLEALVEKDVVSLKLPEGTATMNARLEYSSERLRLLFVGITRARESLMISWNTGRREDCRMSLPLEALHEIWKGFNDIA